MGGVVLCGVVLCGVGSKWLLCLTSTRVELELGLAFDNFNQRVCRHVMDIIVTLTKFLDVLKSSILFYNVPEYSTILKWTTMFLLELVLKKIHRDSLEFKLCKNIRLFIRMKRNIRIEYSFSYRYDPNKSNCVFLLVSNEYE